MPTNTTPALPAHRSTAGFPLQACTRCGGGGHYSFNSVTGSTCFGCGGTGWVVAAGARKAHGEYHTAFRAETQPMLGNVERNDIIEWPYRSDQWHTVETTLVDHDTPCGWSNGEECAWRIVIHLDDGEPINAATHQVVNRKKRDTWHARRAEYVEAALKGWRRSGKKGGVK